MATSSLHLPHLDIPFWRKRAFQLVLFACGQFLVLSTLAMFFYAGGTSTDKTTTGYSFFTNFFSDLGLTQAHNGQPNPIAMPMFMTALTLAGAGLILFFIAFTQFFKHNLASRILSWLGTLIGVGAGACFIGVAWTPADVFRGLHGTFVLNAFGLFLLAVTVYVVAMLVEHHYPSRYTIIFITFDVLLALYFYLITNGPRGTPEASAIQATGQKAIVYASIVSIVIQSLAAMKVARARVGTPLE